MTSATSPMARIGLGIACAILMVAVATGCGSGSTADDVATQADFAQAETIGRRWRMGRNVAARHVGA